MKYMPWLVVAAFAAGAAAAEHSAQPVLTVASIVEKNVAARGGLEAWRKIETMAWRGHIEGDQAPGGLPFVMQLKRPNKTLFEIKAPTQQAVRAFDGRDGWKLRATQGGRPDIQSFTPDELTYAMDGEGLDGLLIDCEAKGIRINLEGQDTVEGKRSFRLRATLRSGAVRHVWLDAETFLEVKYDRQVRSAPGTTGTVTVYYRDYQTVEGVKIPTVIETRSGSAKATSKMVIEKVAINPPIEDRLFKRPHLRGSNVVTVGPEPPSRPARQPDQSRPAASPAAPPAGPPAATPVPDARPVTPAAPGRETG